MLLCEQVFALNFNFVPSATLIIRTVKLWC